MQHRRLCLVSKRSLFGRRPDGTSMCRMFHRQTAETSLTSVARIQKRTAIASCCTSVLRATLGAVAASGIFTGLFRGMPVLRRAECQVGRQPVPPTSNPSRLQVSPCTGAQLSEENGTCAGRLVGCGHEDDRTRVNARRHIFPWIWMA